MGFVENRRGLNKTPSKVSTRNLHWESSQEAPIMVKRVLSTSILKDSKGRNIGSVSVARDLREIKKTMAALKDSERKISDIFNFLPDATFVIDINGKVIAWNRAMEDLTNVNARQMLGKDNYEYSLPFYGFRRPILIDMAIQSPEDIKKYFSN